MNKFWNSLIFFNDSLNLCLLDEENILEILNFFIVFLYTGCFISSGKIQKSKLKDVILGNNFGLRDYV